MFFVLKDVDDYKLNELDSERETKMIYDDELQKRLHKSNCVIRKDLSTEDINIIRNMMKIKSRSII